VETKELQGIVDKIDALVAEVRTTSDPELRMQRLQEGLKCACQLVTKLNRRLTGLTERVLKESGLSQEHASIPFRDLVFTDEAFAPFQSREALLDFLAAAEPLLVAQLFLTKEKIKPIVAQVRGTYEQFMDQKVGLDAMCSKFELLERLFCRPPFDGHGGSPLLDGDPKSGPSRSRGETVCTYLQTLAAIGNLVTSAIPLFAGSAAGVTNVRTAGEEESLRRLSLLSLLMLSGFADAVAQREVVPEEAYAPMADALASR